MTVCHTFKKSERLCHTRDFQRVKHNGRYFFFNGISARILKTQVDKPVRLGIIVGRKFGIAVKRNRVKRIIREVFRLNKHRLEKGHDIVVVPRTSAIDFSCLDMEKAIIHICATAGIITEKNKTT